jgi:hypothetical protein
MDMSFASGQNRRRRDRSRAAPTYRWRFQVRPLGGFPQADVNPELVRTRVGVPVLTGPVKVAFPVQRPTPLSVGPESVAVPEKFVLVTAPLNVPFQSNVADVQVPVTLLSVCARVTTMGAAGQFADWR